MQYWSYSQSKKRTTILPHFYCLPRPRPKSSFYDENRIDSSIGERGIGPRIGLIDKEEPSICSKD